MKICQRKPIYRKVTSYFILGYRYVTERGETGFGYVRTAVTHYAKDKPCVCYGSATASVKRLSELGNSTIIFISEKEISKEYFEVANETKLT